MSDQAAAPPAPAPLGVSTPDPQVLGLLSTLSKSQQSTYAALSSLVGGGKEPGILGGFFEDCLEVLDEIADSITGGVGGGEGGLLAGLGGGGSGVMGGGGVLGGGGKFPSRPTKDKVSMSDMLALPAEFALGYIFIYNKLEELFGESSPGRKGKKGGDSGGKGIGGLFSGLLKGAEGLALIAIGLVAFAGAMILFQFIQWDPALTGLIAFGVFVVGMVLIAKKLGDNMADFKKFAEGILLMTAGIVLFNFAIWISSKTLPYWPSAWQSLVAYGIFVGLMTMYAKSLGEEMGTFLKFAAATVVLIAGLILFDIAIVITAMTAQFIVPALAGLITFGVFVLAMVGLAILVSSFAPLFLAFAAGVVLLIAGLLLFGFTVSYFATLGPKIDPAAKALADSLKFLKEIGNLAKGALEMLGLFIAFSVAIVVLSVALLLWGAAVLVMGALEKVVPHAVLGIEGSYTVFKSVKALAAELGFSMLLLVAFGAAIAVLSLGLLAWGAALSVLGELSDEKLARAKKGLDDSLAVLGQMKGVFDEVKNLAAFGVALGTFSNGMDAFAGIIDKISRIGEEQLDRAKKSITEIVFFLTDAKSEGSFGWLVETMNVIVMAKLNIFGHAIKPLGEAMSSLATAFVALGEAGPDTVTRASSALTSIIEVLPKLASVMDTVGLFNDIGGKFRDTVTGIGKGLENLSKAEIDAEKISAISGAITKLNSVSINGDAFTPLLKLLDRQKEIDRLADSLDRVAKSLEPPKEGGWITRLGNMLGMNGGAVAGTEPGATEPGQVKRESPTDLALLNMDRLLTKWDPLVAAIAANTANTTEVTNMEATINALAGASGENILPGNPLTRPR